jgi:general secretion pathway protein E/type IV pilus assembly protein PilB
VRTADDDALKLALENGLLTPTQLSAARRRFERDERQAAGQPPLLDWLIEQGALDAWSLARLLAEKNGLATVDLRSVQVAPAILAALPQPWAEHYNVFPFAREGATLRVAVSDPSDCEALDGLGQVTQLALEAAIAPAEDIRQAIERHYHDRAGGAPPDAAAGDRRAATPGTADDEAPVIRLVETILRQAVARRASDIHFEPLEQRFRVRYRIDGVLQEGEDPPRRLQRAVISRLKIIANMNIAEKRLPQDGRSRITLEGRTVDLRVSSLPTVHGEAVVLRLLEQEQARLGLAELGLDRDVQPTLERLLALPDGIVLVTGPTGSGKTTTLYACLHHLNRPDRKIITVEDPVEYEIAGINQVPVRAAVGMTFAAALRAMLRQAPNIIMVGEIRDRETAEIAITAALTGHLVFSTLHTNDAPGAVTRLLDLGVEPFLVASALRAVVAQRLVRRICPDCARPQTPAPGAPGGGGRKTISEFPGVARACPACAGTGYHGRLGIFELLLVDGKMQELIHGGAGAARLRGYARAGGMRSLREDGLRKVREGSTTIEEVLAETVADAN